MRQKRAKTYKKLLAQYVRYFGLRVPLQVLIDAEMATTLSQLKLSSEEVVIRLEGTMQVSAALPASSRPQSLSVNARASMTGASSSRMERKSASASAFVKPMITQCCINDLYDQQKKAYERRKAGSSSDSGVEQAAFDTAKRAVDLAKTWERRFCNHKPEDGITSDDCILSVLGSRNKHRYCLAINSRSLRSSVDGAIAGVPVVHTNEQKVLVMKPMSTLTKQTCARIEREKQEQPVQNSSSSASGAPRKRKAKGPNPLSMKKKKVRSSTSNAATGKA